MSGILTCLIVLYDEPHSSSLQLGEEYLAGMLYKRGTLIVFSCCMMSLTAAASSWERNISLGCSMSGTLTCLIVLYDEPDRSRLQLGEEYLAGMLYERDSHLSYRAV